MYLLYTFHTVDRLSDYRCFGHRSPENSHVCRILLVYAAATAERSVIRSHVQSWPFCTISVNPKHMKAVVRAAPLKAVRGEANRRISPTAVSMEGTIMRLNRLDSDSKESGD